jgi:hypothetical protein
LGTATFLPVDARRNGWPLYEPAPSSTAPTALAGLAAKESSNSFHLDPMHWSGWKRTESSYYMKRLLSQLMLLTFATSCASLKPGQIPGSANLISAACYIDQLKEAGQLPGIAKSADYTFQSMPTTAPDASAPGEPSKLVIEVSVKDNKKVLYWFYIQKVSRGSNWEMAAACRTDAIGENPEWLSLHR